jgi:hypothetical protein
MPVLSIDPDRRGALDPLELYASAIDTSDYVARVAPLVRRAVPDVGELLDVGAGGGQLGAALRDPLRPWMAIEPSSTMRRRLANLFAPPLIVAEPWTNADIGLKSHDTVLAATMPALLETPQAFFAQCRAWARRTVIWVVPSQVGPRGLCFAGCLPAAWHGEDETPGIEIVLAGLPHALRPHEIAFADWTFSGVVEDLGRLSTYLADRLGWPREDARRTELADLLAAQAVPDAAGFRLNIPRKSAVLAWRVS